MTNVEFTSEAIRSAKFKEKLRGYPPEEVDAFLERCASALDQLTDRLAEMNARALRAEAALAGNSEADESVRRTLVLAQRTAEMAVREANDEATQIRAAARTEADRIVTEVRVEAHRVESDAAERAAAVEHDAAVARAAAIEKAAATVDAANSTAEATFRDAARQAAALESDISEEMARRRTETEAEIDARRLQALQEIEESVSSLRAERERLSIDVSAMGARLDAERSHVLDALRSATARLDAAFAGAPLPETADAPIASSAVDASDTSHTPEAGYATVPDGSIGGDAVGDGPLGEGPGADGLAEVPGSVGDGLSVAAPAVDEPAIDEPAVDAAAEEPGSDEIHGAAADGPVADVPALDEPALDEPAPDEPALDEAAVDEPAAYEPTVPGAAAYQPAVAEPAADETAAYQPAVDVPAVDETVAYEPATYEPAAYEPAAYEGAAYEPAVYEPSVGVPTADGPAPDDVHSAAADGPVAEEQAGVPGPAVDQPAVDEPEAVEASAWAHSPDAGAHRIDAGETLSLTVVDGWVVPDGAEQQLGDDASEGWSWSPEPEVAATPAATWFPESVIEDSTPDHDHVSVGDAWGAWSEEQGATWTSDQDDHATPPPLAPSEPAPGRSTIFQPVAGWASTAESAPASEPWSAWNAGQTSPDPVSASPPAEAATWKPAWQAEPYSRHPARTEWESAPEPAPWSGEEVRSPSGPETVGSDSPAEQAAPVSNPAWGSTWQPAGPDPTRWESPTRDEAAWSSPSGPVESYPATEGAATSSADAGPAEVVAAASDPVGAGTQGPNGWEPAPGDLHDPWRDLPQPGVASGQSDDAPPPRLLFTLEDDGRPAEPGGDSSPDSKPRKSLLGRRRF